jgi:hypothetical protein
VKCLDEVPKDEDEGDEEATWLAGDERNFTAPKASNLVALPGV